MATVLNQKPKETAPPVKEAERGRTDPAVPETAGAQLFTAPTRTNEAVEPQQGLQAPIQATHPTEAATSHLRSERVWRALSKASFAVLSYVSPAGEPRSSGVVYATVGRRLYVATAPDSWKARDIASGGQVALTVPVRRGGILSLLFPIPPATISFHARAIVHPAGALTDPSLSKQLASLVPPERRTSGRIIEILPEGQFLTYGLGVSLRQMAKPSVAGAHVPVS